MLKYFVIFLAVFLSADAFYFWYNNKHSKIIFLIAVLYYLALAFATWLISVVGIVIGLLLIALLVVGFYGYCILTAMEVENE